jgi:hypothetical protein
MSQKNRTWAVLGVGFLTLICLLAIQRSLRQWIIVDAGGNIRRRFVGSRTLLTFESMVAEAEKPLAQLQKQTIALK